jgi:hypothetical protein
MLNLIVAVSRNLAMSRNADDAFSKECCTKAAHLRQLPSLIGSGSSLVSVYRLAVHCQHPGGLAYSNFERLRFWKPDDRHDRNRVGGSGGQVLNCSECPLLRQVGEPWRLTAMAASG